jgi:hypothetical protein
MQSLGTLMPAFLFGGKRCETLGTAHYVFLPELQKKWRNAAKAEMIREKKNARQQRDILALEIMSLEEQLDKLDQEKPRQKWQESLISFQKRMDQFLIKTNTFKTQIETKSKTYETTYGENIQKYKARFESDLKMRTDAVRNQYVMEKFHEANAALQAAIRKSYPKAVLKELAQKSYPEAVLKELAQFTADCLSEDPTQVPTAKEGYQKITDLFLFSDWSNGQ